MSISKIIFARPHMNNNFLRSIAQAELSDTLFFATSKVPKKEKSDSYTSLEAAHFKLKIYTDRNIVVNGEKCRSIREAKIVIQSKL